MHKHRKKITLKINNIEGAQLQLLLRNEGPKGLRSKPYKTYGPENRGPAVGLWLKVFRKEVILTFTAVLMASNVLPLPSLHFTFSGTTSASMSASCNMRKTVSWCFWFFVLKNTINDKPCLTSDFFVEWLSVPKVQLVVCIALSQTF